MTKIFPVILEDDLDKSIEEYKIKNGIRSKKECVIQLLKQGLKK